MNSKMKSKFGRVWETLMSLTRQKIKEMLEQPPAMAKMETTSEETERDDSEYKIQQEKRYQTRATFERKKIKPILKQVQKET